MAEGPDNPSSASGTPGGGGRDANGRDRDRGPTTSASTAASTSAAPHPLGHGLRRAATVAETSQLRRRSTMGPGEAGKRDSWRRSSNMSEYSVDMLNGLNGHAEDAIPRPTQPAESNWQSVPLVFALLPAVGGLIFEGGSALVTDFILLCLAAVFLHWSITQPWTWYHSAQAIRLVEEAVAEVAVDEEEYDVEVTEDDESRDESPSRTSASEGSPKKDRRRARAGPPQAQHRALRELYFHEVMALFACFLFPVFGASILHAIRTQLSRPSEGLVSNYNLTVFLLAAEIRPVRHLFRLLEARTLHLQRLVLANPFGPSAEPKATASQVAELIGRIEELELRAESTEGLAAAATAAVAQNGSATPSPAEAEPAQVLRKETILRETRSLMQPDIDALNRAVRRYEKKQTILAIHLDNRLQLLDTRLDDAMSLAAHAAKNSRPRQSLFFWLVDQIVFAISLPFRGVWLLFTLPYRALAAVLGRDHGYSDRASRGFRSGRSTRSSSLGGGGDRFPARLSRR